MIRHLLIKVLKTFQSIDLIIDIASRQFILPLFFSFLLYNFSQLKNYIKLGQVDKMNRSRLKIDSEKFRAFTIQRKINN